MRIRKRIAIPAAFTWYFRLESWSYLKILGEGAYLR